MGEITGIAWTDHTWNPWRGCDKVSPGCAHCYSEKITLRFDRGKFYNSANMEELEPFLDERELRLLTNSGIWQGVRVAGSKVFVGDMTDVFGEWVPDEMLDRLFAAFAVRPDVTFQVLTKRALRMQDYFAHYRTSMVNAIRVRDLPDGGMLIAPLPNVWLGVSVENQAMAEERIPHLLQTPAAVRFVSYEPALGPVDFRPFLLNGIAAKGRKYPLSCDVIRCIDWIICGGESGPGKRPFNPDWGRSVRDRCREAAVPFFMKQIDKVQPIPDDLLVREFP